MKPHYVASAMLFGIFLCYSSANTLKAQSKKVSGYYLNVPGDTVRGIFNDYKNWEKSPATIDFTTNTGEVITLTTSNSKKVFIEGFDSYIPYNGNRLINPIDFSDAVHQEKDSLSTYSQVNSFVRIIFEGEIFSLLELQDNIRTNFFIMDDKGVITELLYKLYRDKEDHITGIDIYKNQLQAVIPELQGTDPGLRSALQNLNYEARSLISLFNRISKTNRLSTPKKIRSQLIIMGGGAFNSFKVSASSQALVVPGKYNSNFSTLVGVGAVFYSQRNFGKFFLSPNLRYYSFSHNKEMSNGQLKSEFSSSNLYIQVAIGMNILNTEFLKWYVSAGYGIGLLSNNKNIRTINGNIVTNGDFGRNSSPVFDLQTGVSIKSGLGFFVGYIPGTSVLNYIQYSGKHSSLQAGRSFQIIFLKRFFSIY
ncbi:MAG: hypothetical protein ABI921_09100, partial [Panacibacter sp.]